MGEGGSPAPRYWLDGRAVTALPLPDRGLEFGDALFETLRLHRGKPLLLDAHLQRLQRGLEQLRFPACEQRVREQLTNVLSGVADELSEAAVRLTLTRGAGPRGYRPPQQATPRILITLTPLDDGPWPLDQPAATIIEAQLRLHSQPALAGLKHANRLEQVMAADEAGVAGADEALMRHADGRVICMASGNLFAVESGRLITPNLHDCGIEGTLRGWLIERLGAEVVDLSLERLLDAQEWFYGNSLVGCRPVAAFAGRQWTQHDTCRQVNQRLAEELP